MFEVVFQDRRCTVELIRYRDGRPTLVLHDARDGKEVAVANVNLAGIPAAPDEVFIKDYAENAGMLAALEAGGIVKATGEYVESGSASIPRAKLLPGFLNRFALVNGVGTDATLGEAGPAKASEGGGLYQVWINTQSAATRINEIFGGPSPPFPNGFLHTADVEAGSVREAYWKAHSVGNILDPADETWKDWQKNDGVRVRAPDVRSADFADVIVSPDGRAHQLINGGFRDIPRATPLGAEPGVERPPASAKAASDGESPSPASIAGDNRPESPTPPTGRRKGKRP